MKSLEKAELYKKANIDGPMELLKVTVLKIKGTGWEAEYEGYRCKKLEGIIPEIYELHKQWLDEIRRWIWLNDKKPYLYESFIQHLLGYDTCRCELARPPS